MAKLNSSVVNGDLSVYDSIAMNGELIDNRYGVSMEMVNPIASAIDSTIYTEPDGSHWAHVFHHNNPASTLFASGDSFTSTSGVNKDSNRWFDIARVANQISIIWEIILVQKRTSSSSTEVYRFKQYYNPMTATFAQTRAAEITKYTSDNTRTYFKNGSSTAIDNMSDNYGGMHHIINNGGAVSNTYLAQNNSSNGNWYGATGCWTSYTESSVTGIPAYNAGVCSSGYMDMYIRIDTLFTQAILKNSNGEQLGSPITLR